MQCVVEKTIFACTLDDDVEGLKSLLESKSDSDNEQLRNILLEKDEVGRSVIFTACMLGRTCILRELVKNAADVNELTVRGKEWTKSLLVYYKFSNIKKYITYKWKIAITYPFEKT